LKLYDSRRAPNPRRVRWFMAEKGIEDIEVVDLSIFDGEHRKPEFLAKAGLPNLPALEMDDGRTITESVAICRYLESVYPEPNLFGGEACEAAVVEMWMRRAEMMLATPLMMLVRHSHPAMATIEIQIPEVAAANRAIAEKGLKMLDRRLAESEFIACERLTIADILAATGIDFARMARFRPDAELVNVKRWLTGMMERPAAKAGV
jgi:glutathione S-transferase